MKNLGEELKEENRKKQEKFEREQHEKKIQHEKEATKEAEERFAKLIEGLEDRIKEENKKGNRSIELISANISYPHLSDTDWKVYFKLESWAKERGLRTYTVDYERNYDYFDTIASAGITWEEPRRPRY